MNLPLKITPVFTTWLAQQDAAATAKIEAKWDETATDPSIAQQHHNAEYARATALLNYCRAELGYDG